MKSIVAILAIVLCAAAVLAAPSTSNPTLSELESSSTDKAKCILDGVGELVRSIDMKKEFEEFLTAVKEFGKNQALCVIIADRDFVVLLKCQAYTTKVFFTAAYKFIREVSAENMHLAKEIQKVVGKCIAGEQANGLETELLTLSEFSEDPVQKFMKRIRCLMMTTEFTVKDTALADIFYEYKPRVLRNFAELYACVRAPNVCTSIAEFMASVEIAVQDLFKKMEIADHEKTQELNKVIAQT